MKTQDRPDRVENNIEADNGEEKPSDRKRPWIWVVGFIGLVVALVVGVRYYLYAQNHAGTDDAYINSDVIEIAPQVGGSILKVYVKENDHVRAGQVLATIDQATYQQAVDQAKANLDLALAQVQGAVTSSELTRSQGVAQVQQAQGVLQQSDAGSASAIADAARAAAAVSAARAGATGALAGIRNGSAAVTAAKAQISRNQEAVVEARAALKSSQNGVLAANAGIASDEAAADKARKDFARANVLFQQGAISAQQYDALKATADQTAAQLSSARTALQTALSNVDQSTANVASAQDSLNAARAALDQANAQLAAARASFQASNDQVEQAIQLEAVSKKGISSASGKIRQAQGQLSQAQTYSAQVEVSRNQVKQADARVEQAKAAYKQALINLQDTTIRAPMDGQVTKKAVTAGSLVQVGTPLMALVPSETMWVEANFKETQLPGVRKGLKAEIDVDAIPGHTFKGTVDSISIGTGATFSLLPPDNATGNFTKVVQRVPVRITFDPGQPDLDLLRAGMSVVATIDLK